MCCYPSPQSYKPEVDWPTVNFPSGIEANRFIDYSPDDSRHTRFDMMTLLEKNLSLISTENLLGFDRYSSPIGETNSKNRFNK